MEKTGNFPVKNRIFFPFIFLPFLLLGESLPTRVTFIGEPTVSLRTLMQAFYSVGYKLEIDTFFLQKSAGELSALARGNKPFNPAALGENLKEEGVLVGKAYMRGGELVLELDTRNCVWNVPLLEGDDGAELKRTATVQWFRLKDVQRIAIQPPYVGRWYPDVAIYNRTLGLLSSLRDTESKEELHLELPQDAYYLKISNTQGMKVLKEGMWIESTGIER